MALDKRSQKLFADRYGPAADYIIEWKNKKRSKVLPWTKTYNNVRARCETPNANKFSYYGGRGIKCLIKPRDLKEVFYRDKAYKMEHPSIDRIDAARDYEPDNIRYVEFSENRLRGKISHPNNLAVYDKIKSIIDAEFDRVKWSPYLRRACLNRMISATWRT